MRDVRCRLSEQIPPVSLRSGVGMTRLQQPSSSVLVMPTVEECASLRSAKRTKASVPTCFVYAAHLANAVRCRLSQQIPPVSLRSGVGMTRFNGRSSWLLVTQAVGRVRLAALGGTDECVRSHVLRVCSLLQTAR